MPQQINFEPINPQDGEEKIEFEPIDFEPIKEEPKKGLLSRGYEKLMGPLLPEADTSGGESLLGRGINIGEDTPLIRNIWPGGIHIPGVKEIYNELIRPASAPIGLGMMGLEGAINRGGLSRSSNPIEKLPIETPVITQPKPLQRLALPPAPESVLRRPSFIAGEAGVAENKPYPIDIGPLNPRMGGSNQGTVLPRELESISNIPPEIAARQGVSLGRPATHTRTPNEAALESLIPDRYKSGRQLISEPSKPRELNIGDPSAPYQLPSAVKMSKVFEDAPASIEEIKLAEPPKTPESTVIPKPGQAKSFNDISPLTANATSADQTLVSREITKPIADTIIKAQDEKTAWIGQTERELSQLSKGLNKNDRVLLGQMIDGQEIPNASPELKLRAEQARVVLDSIHDMFPEGSTKAGENVGYLENYFTHIQQQPEDIKSSINNIIDHHFGVFKGGEIPLGEEGKQGLKDFFNKGMGDPSSPYVEPRSGQANNLVYDVNKVFPAYIESAARVIFDKPAVESATKMLKDIPDSNLKELATWYIKNYSRYDAEAGLHKAWSQWANTIARVTSRSLLGFNTGLQTLHLARIPANLWPELGTKYTMFGLKKIAANPVQSWTEAAKLGLLQNEIRPFAFKTPIEKFDSISNFLSLADYLDKTAGYFGFKEKFMSEQGMAEKEASLAALRETKRVSQTSDPARQMKLMSSKSNIAGGEVVSKLGWQFKQVPAKIVEQYMRIASQAKNDPKQAARMLAGVGIALGANEGLRTFHIDPAHMIPTGVFGAFGDTAYKVAHLLSKGDWMGAVEETALWAIPGGKSIQRQFKQGPSAIQP